ncbi:glycoside hydrolase family 172 protein [Alicyclobacillus fodiniaquatilis]|uniref:Glycoside hydrolase family 172 protein n=1 Tax=Alicyclobacillus fodiniaquatilis TaxID=1661150 RepID=A0ABW4JN62_9BACL
MLKNGLELIDLRFNGLGMGLGNLSLLSDAKTRSISAENFTGEKGKGAMASEGTGKAAARDLGVGWKVSPSVVIPAHDSFTLAHIQEAGVIQHIWLTCGPEHWRNLILRMYWDDEQTPSVETPLGDFFCNGWGERCNVNSLPVAVNPAGGMNSYWEMPFRKTARITVENLGDTDAVLYYQITYSLTEVPDDAAYFHAQWRRSNPVAYKGVHTLLEHVSGKGHYVGTYLAWGVNNNGWWGEGEIKFYLDGDDEYPTICGTGTEDYFGGAWNFEHPHGQYGQYSTAYLGLPQIIKPDGLYRSQQRFGMYRWHVMDPIRFEEDLKVTIQALGWRSGGRYLPLQDDIASVSFWYQTEPHAPFPSLPEKDGLEII